MIDDAQLNADLMCGAPAIAEFMFGSPDLGHRVYKLVDKQGLPSFKLGGAICARKSTILRWIANQESESLASAAKLRTIIREEIERLDQVEAA